MPAIIDSKGNPGIGGSIIGAVTEIELDVIKAVVGEVTTVATSEVITTTVAVELCEVIVLVLVELVVWVADASIVRSAEPESLAWLPVTVIVYTAAATFATTNEPVTVPAEIEQDGDVIERPVIVQVESLRAKPDPVTATLVPTSAELGLIVMDGIGRNNWKLAVAESPAGLPVTATE
jgi:hypothetical protein